MLYRVKSIFFTLQGEGVNAGRPAVFLRFSGCNLWSGIERSRPDAICQFCDTDFAGIDGVHGGVYQTAQDLALAVSERWPGNQEGSPFVVATGGEPLLQLDQKAIYALKGHGFEVAVETNGTVEPPEGIDWLTVSPKAGTEILANIGDEMKLVFPQPGLLPEDVDDRFPFFSHYLLQPKDGTDHGTNVRAALEYVKLNPRWRLSLQIHKLLEVP